MGIGNDQRRPADNGSGVEKVGQTTASMTPAKDIATDLRRRRAASRRLELLACGRRDPLDPHPDAPHEQPAVRVRAIGRTSTEFVGCDSAVQTAAIDAGVPYTRATRSGWVVHERNAETLLSLLECRGYRIEVAF